MIWGIEILNLLDLYIKDAEKIKEEFSFKNKNSAEIQFQAIKFQESILRFLDYLYTNFPTNENINKKLYFPRPKIKDDKKRFLARTSYEEKRKKNAEGSEELKIFLGQCFDIIKRNNFAISKIESKIKHEPPNDFGKDIEISNCHLETNDPSFIKIDQQHGINIGEGTIKLTAGKLVMTNCNVKGTLVKKFEAQVEQNGKILLDEEYIDFLTWSEECINTCKDILETKC